MAFVLQKAKKLQRLYHTLKPLRFEQVWYRLMYKLLPLRQLNKVTAQQTSRSWLWLGPEVQQASFLGNEQVCFLNLQASVNTASDWNNPAYEKLWLYNLHYFDDLNARNSLSRKDEQLHLIRRWIAENPPVAGNGWEPYPLSLRLVNWIKWYNRVGLDDQVVLGSIALQAQALSKQLEFHILGNHLFANAKALVFVGCFLQGKEADSYLALGLQLLKREIPEQFLEDGGHFELSPMYHCILLWDLLDLINLAQLSGNNKLSQVVDSWRSYALRAFDWLNTMTHPDGEVSFFNDSTIGIASSPEELSAYARSIGLAVGGTAFPAVRTLTASGYSRISMPAHTVLFDHANVGPDYLPGHAHADTLSLEWSVGTQRVLVNSGTSLYGVSAERLLQRKTCSHNTVVVDDQDSSEVWSGFRVARRAYATLECAEQDHEQVMLLASHNGYQRLKNKVTHQRQLNVKARSLLVRDKLTGCFSAAAACWFLHPDIQVQQVSATELYLTLPAGTRVKINASAEMHLSDSLWHPGFGVTVPNKKLTVAFTSDELMIGFSLE